MRLPTYAGALALMLSITGPVLAQETTSPAEGSAPAGPIAEVGGKTVTADQLTSFASVLEMSEGRSPDSPEALLEEYVLTTLHKEIPTTITRQETATTGTQTLFPSMSQRNLLKKTYQMELRDTIEVPRSEMETWYTENVSRYTTPERVKAYHLFMETSADEASSSPESTRKRLMDVKAQADKGTSFSELAEKYSEAASGRTGGEIGFITRRMPIGPQNKPMNLLLEEALFSLSPGKTSDVVATSHGLHLLYVSDNSTTKTPTVDDMLTSGILPSAIAQDRLTSAVQLKISNTVTKYKGEVAEVTSATQEQLTTGTPAFTFNGKTFTVQNLEQIYGVRFTRVYDRSKGDPERLKDLLKQAMDDEALVQAAADAGIANRPAIKAEMDSLKNREDAVKHIQAIIAEGYPVTEDRLRAEYAKQSDGLRQAEAEGFLLTVKATESTSPAEQGRNRELARKEADAALERLNNGEDFEKVAREVSDDTLKGSGGKVARHVIGQTTDTAIRFFDQAVATVTTEGDLSKIMPMGNDFVIIKLTKRYPGEPVAFDQIKPRLQQSVQAQNAQSARKDMVKKLEEAGKVKYLPGAAPYGKGPNAVKEGDETAN